MHKKGHLSAVGSYDAQSAGSSDRETYRVIQTWQAALREGVYNGFDCDVGGMTVADDEALPVLS